MTSFDDPEFHSRQHGKRATAERLSTILLNARSGALKDNWRDDYPPTGPRQNVAEVYTDAENLANLALYSMPTQPWEPRAQSPWRIALDGWYLDLLDAQREITEVINDSFTHAEKTRVNSLRDTLEKFNNLPRGSTLSSDVIERFANASDLQRQVRTSTPFRDFNLSCAQSAMISYDQASASYLAGRAAGGDDIDWIGWYRQRIANWPAPAAETELAGLDQPDNVTAFQKLPDYWLSSTINQ